MLDRYTTGPRDADERPKLPVAAVFGRFILVRRREGVNPDTLPDLRHYAGASHCS